MTAMSVTIIKNLPLFFKLIFCLKIMAASIAEIFQLKIIFARRLNEKSNHHNTSLHEFFSPF